MNEPNTFRITIAALKAIAEAMGDDTPAEVADAIERYNEVTSPEPLVWDGVAYTKAEHKQFILDAEDNGYTIKLYHGRNFWHGPAVELEQGDSGFTTDVRTQEDGMGLGSIVYPVESDSSLRRS